MRILLVAVLGGVIGGVLGGLLGREAIFAFVIGMLFVVVIVRIMD